MSDLTDDAKKEIADAVRIVRQDKQHAMLRDVHKRTTPKEPDPVPVDPPKPVDPPPTPPPTPPTPPPAPANPPPPKPVDPPPAPVKNRSRYWGDLD